MNHTMKILELTWTPVTSTDVRTIPRGHGDVVEDEPGRGQGAQPPLLAVLLLLHRAVAAPVLLAGRHGSPPAREREAHTRGEEGLPPRRG